MTPIVSFHGLLGNGGMFGPALQGLKSCDVPINTYKAWTKL